MPQDESSEYIPKTVEEVEDQIDGVIGDMLMQQQKLAQISKRKNTSALDKKLNDIMASIKQVGAELIRDKMLCVNQPEYLAEKQRLLNEIAEEDGTEPRKAKIDELEYLRIMSEVEL